MKHPVKMTREEWRAFYPIQVPAHTYDPDEGCLCYKCEDSPRLVRKGNKLVCPNGCEGVDVLILSRKSDKLRSISSEETKNDE